MLAILAGKINHLRLARHQRQSSNWNMIVGLLIYTLISENQGLQKSRSVSNLIKISGPADLDFFPGLPLEKKLGLYHKYEKNRGDKLKKKKQVCRT